MTDPNISIESLTVDELQEWAQLTRTEMQIAHYLLAEEQKARLGVMAMYECDLQTACGIAFDFGLVSGHAARHLRCAYCQTTVKNEDIGAHIAQCDKHPMALLRIENEYLKMQLRLLREEGP